MPHVSGNDERKSRKKFTRSSHFEKSRKFGIPERELPRSVLLLLESFAQKFHEFYRYTPDNSNLILKLPPFKKRKKNLHAWSNRSKRSPDWSNHYKKLSDWSKRYKKSFDWSRRYKKSSDWFERSAASTLVQ